MGIVVNEPLLLTFSLFCFLNSKVNSDTRYTVLTFRFLMQCKAAILDDPTETAKVCVPAMIYTLQNNLYYIALSHLEATTFCLAYQMKIFTTALFLRFMLKRKLSMQQWFALILLAVGVADVQIEYKPPLSSTRTRQYPAIGFTAVISMCFTSAFAGVYLEKVLKGSVVNIWMQNIRLSLLGIPISAISVILNDYDLVAQGGIFRGFDELVWIMTITNSVGGLLISIVIKYADNILKAYAQSLAIVGAAAGSWILFDFTPNFMFTLGAFTVITSVYMYTAYPYMNGQVAWVSEHQEGREIIDRQLEVKCNSAVEIATKIGGIINLGDQ
uniref:UDP-galactose/UDP-N-acetylglucosamine transporter srf-3 n=1 Tax=Ascaris suum TaxID=6253 RepID=F1L7G5_ASCSU